MVDFYFGLIEMKKKKKIVLCLIIVSLTLTTLNKILLESIKSSDILMILNRLL